ncbi:MAG: hypothetical protein LBI67_07170 [Treponema sp.]|jgi:hypothetical protein|nr:hypothetical protein [Treponema sp.]
MKDHKPLRPSTVRPVSRRRLFFLAVLVGLSAGTFLWGQEAEYRIEADGRFTQTLRWAGQRDALYYEVEIEKQAGEQWEKTVTEKTEFSPFEVSLEPGVYRWRVRVYDVLARPREASDWIPFEVLMAKQPVLERFSPEVFYVDEDVVWNLTLFGDNLTGGIEVSLVGSQGRIIRPDTITAGRSEEDARLVFSYGNLEVGEYTVHAVNPGGLTADLGIFRIAFKKPVDINISAGYRPMISLYGRINELLETRFFPAGAYSRLSLMFFKRQWGYMGLEIEPSWTYLSVTQDDYSVFAQMPGGTFYGVYQKWFSNRVMAFNFRIGGGVYSVLDYHFVFSTGKTEPMAVLIPVVAAGASFQWFVRKPFFVEAGVNFAHLFTVDNPSPGYLQPFAGAGWQF